MLYKPPSTSTSSTLSCLTPSWWVEVSTLTHHMTCHVTCLLLGDYDALLVLMLLPRMCFKSELVMDQLKQQHKYDEAMGSLSSITPAKADELSFVSVLLYKLTTLSLLVNQANR